jgi:hypothetical protein
METFSKLAFAKFYFIQKIIIWQMDVDPTLLVQYMLGTGALTCQGW